MKTDHYNNVYIVFTFMPKKELTKVEVFKKFFPKEGDHLLTFWVPYIKVTHGPMGPCTELIKARCKRDANITFDHYGCLLQMEK